MTTSTVVYRSNDLYCSHPCITSLKDGSWLLAFSAGPAQNPVRHPPDEPEFINLLVRSTDLGKTWSAPVQIPGEEWTGVENPGIAQISTGDVLLNQWRYRWLAIDEGNSLSDGDFEQHYWFDQEAKRWRPLRGPQDLDRHSFPYLRADQGAYVHVSSDGGDTWTDSVEIDIAPYLGAFSPKGAIELADGTLVLALGSQDHDPLAANFVVRSEDQGRTWGKPIEAAREPDLVFSEPSVAETPSGRLLLISREESTGYLHQSHSDDGGLSWSSPRRLPLWGYPAHCIRLRDGRMLMVYGRRRDPYGIRAVTSADEGETWSEEVVIRDDLAGTHDGLNLGYPSVVEYEDGKLFVAYYSELEGATCIQGSWVEV